MESTPYLYDTLLSVLSQHAKWLDGATAKPWRG